MRNNRAVTVFRGINRHASAVSLPAQIFHHHKSHPSKPGAANTARLSVMTQAIQSIDYFGALTAHALIDYRQVAHKLQHSPPPVKHKIKKVWIKQYF